MRLILTENQESQTYTEEDSALVGSSSVEFYALVRENDGVLVYFLSFAGIRVSQAVT